MKVRFTIQHEAARQSDRNVKQITGRSAMYTQKCTCKPKHHESRRRECSGNYTATTVTAMAFAACDLRGLLWELAGSCLVHEASKTRLVSEGVHVGG